jgi:D-alanyl-D-alanine carboxypeptidase
MEEFEKMMSMVVKPAGSSPVYNCMLSVKDGTGSLDFSGAKGTSGEMGETISPESCFRTGSITKLFTATVILQLMEEGLLRLEDSYFDLITRDTMNILSRLHFGDETNYSEKITIFHLLHHSSGLQDYFSDDDRFLTCVMQHPSQLWGWELVIEKYFEFELNIKPSFVPGNGFHYSDTNYLLLAILIEQITKKPLQQVYREKIITPLGLNNTYLEFYELPAKIKPVVYPYYGIHSLEKVNTSFDWGGGGLISTMHDLDIFLRSLNKGILFKKTESLRFMMRFQNTNSGTDNRGQSPEYGLGVQKRRFPGHSFVGHNSAYGSVLFHEPEKDISIVLSLNQAAALLKVEWLMKKIIPCLQKRLTHVE